MSQGHERSCARYAVAGWSKFYAAWTHANQTTQSGSQWPELWTNRRLRDPTRAWVQEEDFRQLRHQQCQTTFMRSYSMVTGQSVSVRIESVNTATTRQAKPPRGHVTLYPLRDAGLRSWFDWQLSTGYVLNLTSAFFSHTNCSTQKLNLI